MPLALLLYLTITLLHMSNLFLLLVVAALNGRRIEEKDGASSRYFPIWTASSFLYCSAGLPLRAAKV